MEEALKKLREMLTDVDHYERKGLWDVLTALRGPDLPGGRAMEVLKDATTGVIRWRVLGPKAGMRTNDADQPVKHEKFGSVYGPDCVAHLEVRRALRDRPNEDLHHFLRHARDAFDALGLEWDAVNE